MVLHNDVELFRQLILLVSESKRMNPEIVEKDYFATILLKSLVDKQPEIIFKGGTSLSKCYKLTQRFSEDVDLSFDCARKLSEGQKRRLKNSITTAVDELGFTLINLGEIRSRRDYNKYIVDYSSLYKFEN